MKNANLMTPARKLTNLIAALGMAVSDAGATMRDGAQAPNMDTPEDRRPNVVRLVKSLQEAEIAIEIVKEDMMMAGQRTADRKAQALVDSIVPDEQKNEEPGK